MKKIFGLIIADEKLDKILTLQKSLYEKISKEFDEFYIINLINFEFFNKKKIRKNQYSNNTKLPHNFKLITPEDEYELKKFMENKNMVAFMGISKEINNFKIQFLIKKYNIRLIYLQNLGAIKRNYLGIQGQKGWQRSGLRYFFVMMSKLATYGLIKILILLNLFSRIDISFESSQTIVDNCNNSFCKKIERLFPFLKICYFKKIIRINSRSFDVISKSKLNLSEEKIVFIDGNFYHADKIIREGKPDEKLKLKYYNQLEEFLIKLSNVFNKKVTICLHPSTNFENYKKHFRKFEIFKYQTSENIRQAFIVVFHESSSIIDAILLKKKIISLKSDALGITDKIKIEDYQKKLGLFSYTLGEKNELDKNFLQNKLNEITKNYESYIKKEIIVDYSILGEDKIIDTVKKEYFINKKYV